MFRKVVQPFYTAYVVLLFLLCLVVVFPIVAVISIGNNTTARSAINKVIKCWARMWLWAIGMPLRKVGSQPAGRYIVVANHISYMDTVVIFPAITGYFRVLGKKEISKVPLVGFIYKQIVILVDRSNQVSRAISMRLMWRVLRKEGHIILFPEGTFNETGAPLKSFYDGAFRLAVRTGASILPIVFPDTVALWHYSAWWKLWPGRNRVIYLDPIPAAGLTPEDMPVLKDRVYKVMEEALTKIKNER